MSDRRRWNAAWEALGLEPDDRIFDEVLERHAEPHRAYHTLHHLKECFAALASASTIAECWPEVEIAIWFHDAIYDTRSKDNEERSGAWARNALLGAGATPAVAERVRSMILATKHGSPPTDNDARLLVDADLSILGAEPQRFGEYEDQIRTEYAWVPVEDFRRARTRVLRNFLERDHIYSTKWFRERLERKARENIRGSLQCLSEDLDPS